MYRVQVAQGVSVATSGRSRVEKRIYGVQVSVVVTKHRHRGVARCGERAAHRCLTTAELMTLTVLPPHTHTGRSAPHASVTRHEAFAVEPRRSERNTAERCGCRGHGVCVRGLFRCVECTSLETDVDGTEALPPPVARANAREPQNTAAPAARPLRGRGGCRRRCVLHTRRVDDLSRVRNTRERQYHGRRRSCGIVCLHRRRSLVRWVHL
jgi:hypothetical protein